MRNTRGITLIELLIVVTVMGLMAAMAIPQFGRLRVQWQVDGAAQQLVGDLSRARVEAVKRNAIVWLARTDATTYTIQYIGKRSLPGTVQFTAGPDTVKFAAFGPALVGAGTFTLALSTFTKKVEVNAAGFASVR
ncbi:MAG: GspH/FimT family pseudopilin [Gemmatimonadetes bacterium]|nr:GspH/FimT family pseudopilin [Gemmatimonadota bacterium]MBI2402866.1 GspH/FimT family pseudopilin [Gemmatimonadota bacterium]